MHIALVAPAWPAAVYPNGIVTYVHWMREELILQGHKVSIFTGRLDAPEPGVHHVRATLHRRAYQWLLRKWGMADDPVLAWGGVLGDAIGRLHRQAPIDVIEMEESFGWVGAVQRRLKVPVVVKLHGPAFLAMSRDEQGSAFARLKIEREGRALVKAAFITSPAKVTLSKTIERYHLEPEIARHVVNPLTLPTAAPVWSLDACERATVLFVGRFDKLKGGDLVLEAFATLQQANPSLRLVFVGPDAGLTELDGLTTHIADVIAGTLPPDVAARVDYRGTVSPVEIYGLRAKALVTIVASRWENHSYTALEAMLQGCPLVSSDAGGQPEIVSSGRTGLLFKAGDGEDLCAKVQSLIDDPEYAARLGASARLYVQMHHHPEVVVNDTLAVYREAVESLRDT